MGRKRALDRVAMGCCVAAMPPEAFLPVQHDKSVRAKKTTSFLFILHIDNFFIIPYAESSRVPNETEERKMAENMVLSFDGTKLFVNKEVDMDCRAVCVIVHGLCEHQGRYDYLAEKMHEMGFGTYRFDHRGHGRSEGERTYYDDFNQLLDDVNVVVDMAVSENSALPVFLLGHSMGGFAVALYGAKYPNKNLRGIITSGALTQDNAGLVSGVPKGLEPHQKLPNEGHDYHPLYAPMSPQLVGAVPVGFETFENEDQPFYPMQNNATYKEVWVHTTCRMMWLIAML